MHIQRNISLNKNKDMAKFYLVFLTNDLEEHGLVTYCPEGRAGCSPILAKFTVMFKSIVNTVTVVQIQ
jgi:hypothetical protein